MKDLGLKVLRWIMIILMFDVAITLLIQTIGRIFNMPFSWTNEFACYNFVWLVFLGAAYVMADNGHITINYFYNKFPRPIRIVLFYARYTIMIGSLVVLLKPAFDYAKSGFYMKSAAMHLPMLFVDGIVLISFIILILISIQQLLKGYHDDETRS